VRRTLFVNKPHAGRGDQLIGRRSADPFPIESETHHILPEGFRSRIARDT
jgi:hypothetical protein